MMLLGLIILLAVVQSFKYKATKPIEITATHATASNVIYTSDKRSIYSNGNAAYTLAANQIDGDFMGPYVFGDKIVFIEKMRNLVLVFSDGRLSKNITVTDFSSMKWFPQYNSISALIRTKNGLLIYTYLSGEAFIMDDEFKIHRLKQLDVDVIADGHPHFDGSDMPMKGVVEIPCSAIDLDDRYITIDLDNLNIVSKGAKKRERRQPP